MKRPKDELGHDLINYDVVRFDKDIESVGQQPLMTLLKSVNWKTDAVWWCPLCKKWSVK